MPPDSPGPEAPHGLPGAPLHRFHFASPRLGWGFMMFGWTRSYLILWDGAAHDDAWFAENHGKIVAQYDDWEGPHYGDGVVLHEIETQPGIRPRDRAPSDDETIRLALRHLRNPIPPDPSVQTWRSVQVREFIDQGVSWCYQALFLEPDGDRDLLRSACLLRSVEEAFEPPESLRLDLLELKGWQDCCVEVTVPREAFRKVYAEAISGFPAPKAHVPPK